jgi:hypothetical protein
VAPNVDLLEGSLDALAAAGAALYHATLYQGTSTTAHTLDRSKRLRGKMIHDCLGRTSTTTRKICCACARSGTGSASPSFGPRPSAEWQPVTR